MKDTETRGPNRDCDAVADIPESVKPEISDDDESFLGADIDLHGFAERLDAALAGRFVSFSEQEIAIIFKISEAELNQPATRELVRKHRKAFEGNSVPFSPLETGKVLGISAQRVSAIENDALETMEKNARKMPELLRRLLDHLGD